MSWIPSLSSLSPFRKLGGSFPYQPEDIYDHEKQLYHPRLSEATKRLLQDIFEGIDVRRIVDYHTHIIGKDEAKTGCRVDSRMLKWYHPWKYMKTWIFLFAAGVQDLENADERYVDRLMRLVKHSAPVKREDGMSFHGRNCILAFDQVYSAKGEPDEEHTTLYVPNKYVYELSRKYPNEFIATCSVHPFRPDALEELDRCRKQGIRIIKWLPNSMNIRPADDDPRYDQFYDKVKELDMYLLIHVGDEHSVSSRFLDNSLGNPLFLRKPLNKGVKVIAAHCATEGSSVDFETDTSGHIKAENFDLFLRLMHDPKYQQNLFADISATISFLRVKYLPRLLAEKEIHSRLVFGSDYPVPAINVIVHTKKLLKYNLITPEQKTCLDELYEFNPLLFDFACKRCLSHEGHKFPISLFMENPNLPVSEDSSSL
ncbi:uncharacterized protein LOC134196973 [Corticium candelabrum]|uniref:uncharacterized protein LOC134196973 n=1 Tax=Corticium candelabrum TaxID=121492 RepID=UPI002E257F9D|nr:uncharacterized protein LOC134196973 [Corticium candelabrum]